MAEWQWEPHPSSVINDLEISIRTIKTALKNKGEDVFSPALFDSLGKVTAEYRKLLKDFRQWQDEQEEKDRIYGRKPGKTRLRNPNLGLTT